MRRHHPPISQRPIQQLKIRLLEQTLRRSLRVTTIRDDNIELIFPIGQELESVAYVHTNVRMSESYTHAWEVFLREPNHRFIDIAEHGLLDGGVFDDFAEDAAVAAADDEDALRVGVRVHRQVGDHFLVTISSNEYHGRKNRCRIWRRENARKFIALGALDDIVEHEDNAVVAGLENEDILILGFFVVEDLVDFEGHGLAGPHVGDFAEPAIWRFIVSELRLWVSIFGVNWWAC